MLRQALIIAIGVLLAALAAAWIAYGISHETAPPHDGWGQVQEGRE